MTFDITRENVDKQTDDSIANLVKFCLKKKGEFQRTNSDGVYCNVLTEKSHQYCEFCCDYTIRVDGEVFMCCNYEREAEEEPIEDIDGFLG